MTSPHLEHLIEMLNKRGYLVVSCPRPEKHKVGETVLNISVTDIPTNTSIPTNTPALLISETDYLDMNAQWPDTPNLFTAQESERYKFYRVSLD